MFARLFGFANAEEKQAPAPSAQGLVSPHRWSPPVFSNDQVKVILFQNNGVGEKTLLYNSHSSTSREVEMGDIMFGSIPLSFKGSSTKIHQLKAPLRFLVTKLFVVPPREIAEAHNNLTSNIADSTSPKKPSTPTPMATVPPTSAPTPASTIVANTVEAIPASGQVPSFTAVVESFNDANLRGISSSGYSDVRRQRALSTSLEYGHTGRISMESNQPSVSAKMPKFALGWILDLGDGPADEKQDAIRQFFFSHFALLEVQLYRLQRKVSKALAEAMVSARMATATDHQQRQPGICFLKANQLQSNEAIQNAVRAFQNGIHFLYAVPRIQEPVWLTVTTFADRRAECASKFIQEFATCIEVMDTKETGFFFSTLLTAVLTKHLAWVPTVTPAENLGREEHCDKFTPDSIALQAKYTPYNPLWAQLVDLYGCIGTPAFMCRTIVSGANSDMVNRALYVLSYFIRCSEVFEREEVMGVPLSSSNLENVPFGVEQSADERFANFDSLPMLSSQSCRIYPELDKDCAPDVIYRRSFGRSLMAAYWHDYLPDFALLGVANKDFRAQLARDLKMSVEHSVLDEQVSQAACILADTDTWICELMSTNRNTQSKKTDRVVVDMLQPAECILQIVSSVKALYDIGIQETVCLMHLEDSLQELYHKALVISEFISSNKPKFFTYSIIGSTLGFPDSDVPLLVAIAAADTPSIISYIIPEGNVL